METANRPRHALLIVERDPDYCELLGEALRQPDGPHATIVRDIGAALLVLHTTKASDAALLPHLVLLDVGPKAMAGFIRQVRHDIRLATIPVAVLVSSDNPKDLEDCRASGADGYVVKPDTFAQLTALMATLGRPGVGWTRCESPAPCEEEIHPR